MACGIYSITNLINGRRYIGQSMVVEKRISRHFGDLDKGRHYNSHLQRAYVHYGPENFASELLETAPSVQLTERENFWIKKFGDECGVYNVILDVEDFRGRKNPFYGKAHSDEARKAMSEAKTNAYQGAGNPNFGKRHSAETRVKMSEGRSNKLDRTKVLEIVELLRAGQDHASIATEYGVVRTAITRIANGTRWVNVTGGAVYPTKYENGKRKFSELHRKKIGNGRRGKKHSESTKIKMREKALNRNRGE